MILLGSCFLFGISNVVIAGWCKVSTSSNKNSGYCIENSNGNGVCVGYFVEDADRCFASGGADDELIASFLSL